MFGNQRKMLRTRNNSEWKHQQKSHQDKRGFYQNNMKPPKLGKLEILEKAINKKIKIKDEKRPELAEKYDYKFENGRVNLPIFVYPQFRFGMNKVSKKTAGLREKAVSNPLILKEIREKAASNSLILKEILSHLNVSSLKTARLVSREWKTMANSELGRRNYCRMRFKRGFLLKENLDLEVLQNPLDLSWMEFDLENLDETELEYILTFCADQIKMLRAPPSNFLLRLLHAGEFPNLKSLSLKKGGNFESSTTTTKNPLERHFLSLLKLLRADSNSNSTADEAKAKPKLELEQFVITDQDFEGDPELLNEINRILESSQKTLKFLELPSAFSFHLSGTFSQLSTIHFYISAQESFASRGFQLPQSFDQGKVPNLKRVRLTFDHAADCRRNFAFPCPEKYNTKMRLSSVINLELGHESDCCFWMNPQSTYHSLPFEWFPWLSAVFPNVQNLALVNWDDEVLGQVFTFWPNLVSLEIQSNFRIRGYNFDNLDSVLTGLSPEKCDELRRKRMLPMSKKVEGMKAWPNLCSLKGLKRLDICSFKPPVTKLSALYAFDLNPDLKVVIRVPKTSNCDCEPLKKIRNHQTIV